MRSPLQTNASQKPSFTLIQPGLLQRKCACGNSASLTGECSDCQRQKLLQRRATNQAELSQVPAIVHEVLNTPGQPLDRDSQTFMKSRFGHDFSQVRVHTDSQAAESAQATHALAYTVGEHIAFASGYYAPHTPAGRKLLAHELTHVVQQRGRSSAIQRQLVIGQSNDDAEREADASAEQVMAGESIALINVLSSGALQRQEADGDAEDAEEPAERPLTRPEEISLSQTSEGGVAGSQNPFTLSLYNFAIDSDALKPRHVEALDEVADMLSLSPIVPAPVQLTAKGHADTTGEPVVNNPLSRRRAQNTQRTLQQLARTRIAIAWAGENEPVTTNDTVEGRSRNRRVDLQFVPTRTPSPSPTEQTPDPQPTPEADDRPPSDTTPPEVQPPEDDSWFCLEHPIICLSGLLPLVCLLFPDLCLPDTPTSNRPQRRPCLAQRPDLPSGSIRVVPIGPFLLPNRFELHAPFRMNLVFKNDDTGCDCSLGEYQQKLKGFVMRDGETGRMQSDPERRLPQLVGGKLDPNEVREDLRGSVEGMPYGKRDAPESPTDVFENPDRDTGCVYRGSDEPTVVSLTPGERIHFRFEFQGRAVDRRDRDGNLFPPVTGWRHWVVEWQGRNPLTPPRSPITPTPAPELRGSGGGGSQAVSLTPHRPATEPIGSGYPSFYAGGTLRRNSVPEQVDTIILGFRTNQSETAYTRIEVRVRAVTPTHVEVETTNDAPMNVAPVTDPPHPEVILAAHRRISVPRSILPE